MKHYFHIRLCTPHELKDIIACQMAVVSSLQRKDFYFPSEPDELSLLLHNKKHIGFIAGAYFMNQLVGFASIANWIGSYYGYSYDFNRIYYSIEDTVVKSEYRGHGIQTMLWNYMINLFPEDVIYLCTIHPENVISIQNAKRVGFESRMSTRLFGGVPRLIMERR